MTQPHKTDSLRILNTYKTPDFLMFTRKHQLSSMPKCALGILWLHIPIANVFSPTLCFHGFSFCFYFHTSSRWASYLAYSIFLHPFTILQVPLFPDPSPPNQNVIRSSYYQKKQQDQVGCFSPVEQIRSSATHTLWFNQK